VLVNGQVGMRTVCSLPGSDGLVLMGMLVVVTSNAGLSTLHSSMAQTSALGPSLHSPPSGAVAAGAALRAGGARHGARAGDPDRGETNVAFLDAGVGGAHTLLYRSADICSLASLPQ
jgi:hypothetical protein